MERTAVKVAGRKIMVSNAIPSIAELSFLAAMAISPLLSAILMLVRVSFRFMYWNI